MKRMDIKKSLQVHVDRLAALHEKMLVVRACETALIQLFSDGKVPGFIHLSLGQEAVAVGVCAALLTQDTLVTTHRGHGHVIARGIALDRFFMELMGRAGGVCGGRGGSMHVADLSLGILGANGIVGASMPIALGSAMAHQARATGGVATAFFGDGAMAEGVLHETLNMASLWRAPLLLVCESNGWSEFSPTDKQFRGSLEGLASVFGVGYRRVDGNDLEQVSSAAREVRARVVEGGPAILECLTIRVRGHFEGDPQKYRSKEDMQALQDNDPVRRSVEKLMSLGIEEAELSALASAVHLRVAAAIAAAQSAPLPDFDQALADVYANRGAATYG